MFFSTTCSGYSVECIASNYKMMSLVEPMKFWFHHLLFFPACLPAYLLACFLSICLSVYLSVCLVVALVGALVVQLVQSWVYDPEDTGGHWFESQDRRKNKNKKTSQVLQPTSPPICKMGTWSCTGGAKHTDCVSLYH